MKCAQDFALSLRPPRLCVIDSAVQSARAPRHSVLYITARQMLRQLREARGDDTLERKLLRRAGFDLLIIDDFGLQQLRQDEPVDLYEVIQRRYERCSALITSSRGVGEWYPLFGNDLLGMAVLDRFRHHDHIVIMDGDSFRKPQKNP